MNDTACHFTLKSEISRLYAVLDADVAARAGWPILDLAAAYLRGGVRLIQLRAKSMPADAYLATASALVQLAHRYSESGLGVPTQSPARVIVNDRADIARLAQADGVHVGQEDLMPAAVRRLLGDAAIVGLSTHTTEQVDRAVLAPVSYVAIGPVFATATKATGYDKVGLEMVGEAARRANARGLPLVAIGGITLETAASVLEAGAASVAVIGDLVVSGDPEARARAYLERLSRWEPPRV